MTIRNALFNKEPIKKLTIVIVLNLLFLQLMGTNASLDISSEIQIIKNLSEETETNQFDGYNLFMLERHNYSTGAIIDRKLLLTNMENNIIFEREVNPSITLADQSVEFINSTTILFGDENGARLWNIETDVTKNLNFSGHHEMEMNYKNNSYFTLDSYETEINGTSYRFDMVNEYNSSGNLIGFYDTRNYVETWQICPFKETIGDVLDLTHMNSIFVDEDENVLYLNSRNLNTFYKIDQQTGDLIWSLGEFGNFTMYDIYGNQRDNLFYHSHSLEKIDYNRFLLFDNDWHNQTNAVNRQARLVEITIDETTMNANVTWEWNAPTEYWSPIWGDCDVLPNNNKLGVFGYTTYQGVWQGSKMVEVDTNGNIVWELVSPIEEDLIYSVYRMERVRLSPITSTPTLINSEIGEYFEWNIWYNFRSKTNFSGRYYIYVNEQLRENKSIVFPKYWLNTTVNYLLNDTAPGRYTITIVVEDEGGHLSTDSEFYNGIGTIEFKIKSNVGLILGITLGSTGAIAASGSAVFLSKTLRKRRL